MEDVRICVWVCVLGHMRRVAAENSAVDVTVLQLLFLMADEQQNVPKEKLLRAYNIVCVLQDTQQQDYVDDPGNYDDQLWPAEDGKGTE